MKNVTVFTTKVLVIKVWMIVFPLYMIILIGGRSYMDILYKKRSVVLLILDTSVIGAVRSCVVAGIKIT